MVPTMAHQVDHRATDNITAIAASVASVSAHATNTGTTVLSLLR